MRLCMLLLLIVGNASSPLAAQTRPTSAVTAGGPTACANLARDYDDAFKELASNFASSVGDNSAPRATLRAMEDANSLAKARITLDLMRERRCPMPQSAPEGVSYLSAALTCATDRLKASGTQSPPTCDRSTWARAGGQP